MLNSVFNREGTITFLLDACRLDQGFEAQLVGLKVKSATTTALVAYVLGELGRLHSGDSENILDALLSFSKQNALGFRQFGTLHVSSWSTSQALLALIHLAAEQAIIEKTIYGLLEYQDLDGSWTFSGKEDVSPIYAVYPVIALIKSQKIVRLPRLAESLKNTSIYISNCVPCSQTELLILEFLRRKLHPNRSNEIDKNGSAILWHTLVTKEFNKLTINEFSSSPFSMTVYGPSLYLFARALVPPDHPFSLFCIRSLYEFRRSDGVSWPLADVKKSKRACTFSTALALLTIHLWYADQRKLGQFFDISDSTYSIGNVMTMIKNIEKSKVVFISYSSADVDTVTQIADTLKSVGCEVIFAEYDLMVGDSISSFINDGLARMEYLVLCLSPTAVSSRYVRDELDGAKAAEWSRQRKAILPALIKDCDIPPIIAAKKYADLSKNFQMGLSHLIKAISK